MNHQFEIREIKKSDVDYLLAMMMDFYMSPAVIHKPSIELLKKAKVDFQFKPELKKYINELAEKYNPKITFKDPKIKLTSETEPIGYPEGIVPRPGTEEVEKTGTIELIVMCTFNKRDYTLKVQYPFSIVYRLTPIIKDFIVFADNIYEEQRADVGVNDKINLLYIEQGQVNENVTPDVANINGKIK